MAAFKTCMPGFPGAPSAIRISKVRGQTCTHNPLAYMKVNGIMCCIFTIACEYTHIHGTYNRAQKEPTSLGSLLLTMLGQSLSTVSISDSNLSRGPSQARWHLLECTAEREARVWCHIVNLAPPTLIPHQNQPSSFELQPRMTKGNTLTHMHIYTCTHK